MERKGMILEEYLYIEGMGRERADGQIVGDDAAFGGRRVKE
jgi:hypothetical protein